MWMKTRIFDGAKHGRTMSLKRDLHYDVRPKARHAVINVSELMKQIEIMSGIRARIRDGYYDQPEVLSEIAAQLSRRVKS
jgi:hypothetical protein